jgi:hypothetical protein
VVLSCALGEKRIPKHRLDSRRYGAGKIQPFACGLGAGPTERLRGRT